MGRQIASMDEVPLTGVDELQLDHDMLVRKSLECRRHAEYVKSQDERDCWIRMADVFLGRAQEIED
jgi:hypothetical protein